MGKTRYQPHYVDGRTVGSAVRDWETRYQAIRPHVGEFDKILDFGCWEGYFSHRLTAEIPHTVAFAVDPKAHQRLAVIPINKILRAPEIGLLPRCDVVLALSVLHHCRPWHEYMIALLSQAKRAFIVEVPHPEEKLKLVDRSTLVGLYEWATGQGTLICETPGRYDPELLRPMMLIEKEPRR